MCLLTLWLQNVMGEPDGKDGTVPKEIWRQEILPAFRQFFFQRFPSYLGIVSESSKK